MDEVAEVKARLEIAEVVGAYLPLKQAGRNLKAPCPFHAEKSASFMVSPEKGIYHCFGCSEGGDIFSFVQKMEGLEFREVLEKLARQAGVELKAKRGEDVHVKRMRERLYEAHELAAKYYQASLVKNMKALEYVMKKRRLNKTTIREWRIGYAPDAWEALTGWLQKKGFTNRELRDAGLAGHKEGRTTVYDMFRGRVTFPICDRDGRVVGFTARVLDSGEPKYLNTPQTALFDKSSVIFGLHLAREAIRAANEVVLVEGQMDVIASHQAGVRQVVATSGTALTLEHLRALGKLTKNIKLAFDADRAGLAATERAIELGQKLGLMLRMVEVEGAKDADELIAQDPALWVEAIGRAKYIMDYLFDRFERDYDLASAVGKRQYTDRVASNIRRLGDAIERDHYVKLLAVKVGVTEEAVRAKLAEAPELAAPGEPTAGRRTRSGWTLGGALEPTPAGAVGAPGAAASGPSAPRAKVQAKGKPSARVRLEELFLALVLAHPLTRLALDDLREMNFSSRGRQTVFQAMAEDRAASGDDVSAVVGEFGDYAKELLLVADHEFAGVPEANLHFQAFTLARQVLLASNTDLKAQLNEQIKEAEAAGDVGEVSRLMGEVQELLKHEV